MLFENIGFNINEGDKIALIAPNGTGKSTLLRILAGKDKSDSGGKITFLRNIRIAFLEQEYEFDPEKTAFRQVIDDSAAYMEGLDEDGIFAYELRVNKFLSNFEVGRDSLMKNLSGGEVKRVALARMLASDADFFIMDEPTNHLDINAIEYLENYLGHSRSTLLMVTHDRFFLDRVCNIILELDDHQIYTYRGNYSYYLEKRQERIDAKRAEVARANNLSCINVQAFTHKNGRQVTIADSITNCLYNDIFAGTFVVSEIRIVSSHSRNFGQYRHSFCDFVL